MTMNKSWPRFYPTIILLILFLLALPQFSFAFEKEIQNLSESMAERISGAGKKRIAVVDFTDLGGDVTELGRFLAEEFSVSLAGGGNGFEVVDRTHLKSIIAEHKLSATGLIDPQTARQLGKIAGVEALVTGTLTPFGESVRVSVKVLDTNTARIIGASRGNIAKTQAIEELLSREIATVGSYSQPSSTSRPPSKTYSPRSDSKCTMQNHCLQGQNFEVRVLKLSQKGKSVNISLSVRNITKEDIKISLANKCAIMTSPEGEEKYFVNTGHIMIKAGAVKNLGYNFKFREEPQKKLFDFILAFNKPAARFSFIDLPST